MLLNEDKILNIGLTKSSMYAIGDNATMALILSLYAGISEVKTKKAVVPWPWPI